MIGKIGFFSLAFSAAIWAESLSLSEAIAFAKQNNSRLKAARESAAKVEGEKTQARSRFLPQVKISGRVTRINSPITIDLRPIRSAILGGSYASAYGATYASLMAPYANSLDPLVLGAANENATALAGVTAGNVETQLDALIPEDQFNIRVQDRWFFNAAASIVWPIFTGGRIISAYLAADENIDVQKALILSEENSVILEVCTRYFSLRLAEELVRLREETAQSFEKHLESAQKLEEGGQISKAERLRVEVGLAEAKDEYENAKRSLSLARLALSSSLGKTDSSISATTPIREVHAEASLENYQRDALENHPGLKQLRLQKKRANHSVSAMRGEYLPTIALFGQKELYTKDLTILEPEWAIGINLEWDLFHGGETAGKVSQAKATLREVENLEHKAVQDISLLVQDCYSKVEYAESRVESLSKTQELADEALRYQTKSFEAGMATSLDVVDAELSDSRIKVAILKARYDLLLALAHLLSTSGRAERISDLLESSGK